MVSDQFLREPLNDVSIRGDLRRVGAVGVDIVRISRVREIAKRRGERFLNRYFSKGEVEYSFTKSDPYPHLAARFAAKEAAFKAFSSAGVRGLPLSSFEVVLGGGGVPAIRDSGRASCRFASDNIAVSLSHDGDLAIAVVMLSGELSVTNK
ncbi:MAG TPA: holo-ACP synthase [bacterium]|nr:holo-ACP synthase [bacterium]